VPHPKNPRLTAAEAVASVPKRKNCRRDNLFFINFSSSAKRQSGNQGFCIVNEMHLSAYIIKYNSKILQYFCDFFKGLLQTASHL
jgi:hypothetical protein